jgi:acetyl esterase/lipase
MTKLPPNSRVGAAILVALGLWASGASRASAEPRVEPNVVYGMYSGLALLMDVHVPETPNGYGVLFVPGSGWNAPMPYGAHQLKSTQIPQWAPALLGAGYTVFVPNHRATPRFQYPAAVDDIQRAVRFIRYNAKKYGIDATRIGGIGGSSGGHLVGLTAMLAAGGIADDPDPVNREPATLQAIVLRAAPSDLTAMIGGSTVGTALVVAFIGRPPTQNPDDRAVYRMASTTTHVSPSAPPTLLLHGDADDIVPYQQSGAMETALKGANVAVKLFRVPGGVHGPNFGTADKPHARFPEVLRETTEWLDRYLRKAGSKP